MPRIGQNIFKNYSFLQKIAKTKSSNKQKRLLRLATNLELFSIIEAAHNILKGRFNLTKRQTARLLPHIESVRKIGRSRTERGARQVLQRGGGIGAVAAILTPILIEVLKQIKSNGE
jgi:hypothetical protein